MTERLDPARTALVVFDMLNGHVKKVDGPTAARLAPQIENCRRLLDAARRGGAMVVFAMGAHRPDGGTTAVLTTDTDNRLVPWSAEHRPDRRLPVAAGTWEGQVIDELRPRPEEYLVPKIRWSAFFGTYLDAALRVRKVGTIVLCGGSTDVGVASTAFSARDLDYELVIASDACSSYEMDNHDQLMRRVFPRMSRVRTTEQVVAMFG